MAYSRRRLVIPAALLFLVVVLSGGQRLSAPTIARAQGAGCEATTAASQVCPNETATEAGFVDASLAPDVLQPVDTGFTPKSYNPSRLYAADPASLDATQTDNSHPPFAYSNATLLQVADGSNGYCVYIQGSTIHPVADDATHHYGFITYGTTTTGPVQDGNLLGSVATTAAVPATPVNGDFYCAIITSKFGYSSINLSWDYTVTGDSTVYRVTLDGTSDRPDTGMLIPIVTVTLQQPTNVSVPGTATVCTVGWDPNFLGGDPALGPGSAPVFTVSNLTDFQNNPTPYFDQSSGEWCAGVQPLPGVAVGTTVTTNVTVSFDAFYNYRGVDFLRKIPHSSTLTNISVTAAFALQHIGADGSLLTQVVSPALVVGAPEVACVSRSVGGTLPLSGVNITATGGGDTAGVLGLTVFAASGTGDFNELNPNVPAGTICLSYTSSTPGEQLMSVTFTTAPPSPTTEHAGPVVVQWSRITHTDLTSGGTPDQGTITGTTVQEPLQFVVPSNPAATGTFQASISLAEFVTGSHKSQGQTVTGFLQGALIHAKITDPTNVCGHFDLPNTSATAPNLLASNLGVPNPAAYNNTQPPSLTPRDVWGFSIGGRFSYGGDTTPTTDDLPISITLDSCSGGSTIHVSVDVFYPGQGATAPAVPTETVDYLFTFTPAIKIPQTAWAGQVVSITYGFSGCAADTNLPVQFSRAANQRGTFLPSPGLAVSADSASGTITSAGGCALTLQYTSEDPGEVDIQAMIVNNPYSKQDFPIFFMAIEDVTLTATTSSNVSAQGTVTATVRGYFVGTNPSGRPQETKPDGRVVPANRWVIPDDWSTLQGLSDFRPGWPGPDLPPLNVTFAMRNDTVVNNYQAGVKNGALGYFQLTQIPDANGVYPMPKTVTVQTSGGSASVPTFGDLNLSFEGCAPNPPMGNPDCKQGDVVGHTDYYAVADYIQGVGKYPQVGSNDATTEWTWGGFKQVTIVNTNVPYQKYVVAHLLDRDGYCNAQGFHDVLGVQVQFTIDSGDGVIVQAQGQPTQISADRRSAITTTFGTQDSYGNPINQDITQKTVADGECQAWVLVSSSLLNPANVLVTFPPQPAPIPGNVRITKVVCSPGEIFTVTNQGKNPVSLAGFALRAADPTTATTEEDLDLRGLLQAGQSMDFYGGPGAGSPDTGWLPSGLNYVMSGGPPDYVRLVWDNIELNRAFCDGTFTYPPIPNPLPPDGEGQILIDQLVPFGMEQSVQLDAGWNLVPAGQAATDIATAFAGHEADFIGVYLWDTTANAWKQYLPGVPSTPSTSITTLEKGQVYWIAVKRPFTVTILK